MPIPGRRVPNETSPADLVPGDYCFYKGRWWGVPPAAPDDRFCLGNLEKHHVVEHEDGTITVSPSILISDSKGEGWHGFLQRGVWSKA